MLTPEATDQMLRLCSALLLYRCGGEQTFTTEEMNTIRNEYPGFQILVNSDDQLVLRSRSADFCNTVPSIHI